MDNLYGILEIPYTSTHTDVCKAYWRQAVHWYPVNNDNDEAVQKFTALSTAYEVLSAPKKTVPGKRMSFLRAIELFMEFTITHIHNHQLLDALTIVRIIRDSGISNLPTEHDLAGYTAIVAMTTILSSRSVDMLSVYNEFTDAEKYAFSSAIYLLARHMLFQSV
jgi:hypothetical protein